MERNDRDPDRPAHLMLSDTPPGSATVLDSCDSSPGDGVQSHTMIMEYAGKEYSFVEEIPDDYMCGVCSKVYKDRTLACLLVVNFVCDVC